MALRFNDVGEYLDRAANLPAISNHSICGVSKFTQDFFERPQPMVAWGPEVIFYFAWEYGQDLPGKMVAGSYNGAVESRVAFAARPDEGAWFFWYVRSTIAGGLVEVGWAYLGDTEFQEVKTFTPQTGTANRIYLNVDSYGDYSVHDLAFVRLWGAVLTQPELLAELASPDVVRTADLIISSPMVGADVAAAAADTSGHGYNWTTHGALNVVPGPDYPAAALPGFAWGYIL